MIAFISHPDCLLHQMGSFHPECPERLMVIENALNESPLNPKIKKYLAPKATREQLLQAHSKEHLNFIFTSVPKAGIVCIDQDTYMNSHTLNAALRSAGSVVTAVDLVMQQEVTSAFCNVRPPGHHAEKNKAMGFCFFNNIAIGVMHALNYYSIKRIAIVDFDVHHGNGTEDIFLNETRVLLCSSFQHPFYPYSDHKSRSNLLNIPLSQGTTSEMFRDAVTKYWLPQLNLFKPELIFISAGFDAYVLDDMSDVYLQIEDYAWITAAIKKIADEYSQGRIISVLEGGYSLAGLGECVLAHLEAL